MEKRKAKKLEIETGLLGFGIMRMPCIGDGDANIDYEKSEKMVDMAIAGGINYFDTAWIYHGTNSERFLGEALVKRHPRDKYYIATKLPTYSIDSEKKLEECFNDHFERMNPGYIDFYLLHNIYWGSWQKLKSYGVIPFIEKKKAEGIIRYVGFSSHDNPAGFEKIVNDYDWDFAQLQVNYMDWDDQGAKQSYAALEKAGVPLVVMEPVRGGGLADPANPGVQRLMELLPESTPASIALRWAASLENVFVVLSGMSNTLQIEENLKTFERIEPLNAGELEAIAETAKIIRALPVVPCSSCYYCSECPQGINIPPIFGKYNSAIAYNDVAAMGAFYVEEHPLGHSAADCVECGKCAEICPQGIDVPAKLKDVAALHEKLSTNCS